jgi:hypothetical protein
LTSIFTSFFAISFASSFGAGEGAVGRIEPGPDGLAPDPDPGCPQTVVAKPAIASSIEQEVEKRVFIEESCRTTTPGDSLGRKFRY